MTEERTEAPGSTLSDLGGLSYDALLNAAQLTDSMDNGALASLLYHANTVPLTPGWLQLIPDQSAAEQFVLRDAVTKDQLHQSWAFRPDSHWLYWVPRGENQQPLPRFKLYVSSMPEDAGEALAAAIGVLVDHGAPRFKVAREPRRLLRPDRMVVYLRSKSQLLDLAADLVEPLAGFSAQGVPFTGVLHQSGILSWGLDPQFPARQYGSSWRTWVTRKLGAYLQASDAPTAQGRVEFVLSRMLEDGVDSIDWVPLRKSLDLDQ